MDLPKMLGLRRQVGAKIPADFPVKLERMTVTETVQFDARVKGFFVGVGGKVDFVASEITVNGAPDMNLRNLFPNELKEVTRYALTTEFPKLLGKTL